MGNVASNMLKRSRRCLRLEFDVYQKFGKRAMDLLLVAVASLVLSPLILLVVLMFMIFDERPIIFKQQRVGRGGEVFIFYKFRTMPVNTGDISSDQLGRIHLGWFPRILRRTNIDELPQLFNVLKGDMSVVGPRPPIVSQSELIHLRRDNGALGCYPGLTGWAQVNSHDGMSVLEKSTLDGEYARSITLAKDIGIILRTFEYLLKPPPVY